MEQDQTYEHALSAALVILGELDRAPGMTKPSLLSLLVSSIMHAMNAREREKEKPHVGFSVN